jgi:hypothetical protein
MVRMQQIDHRIINFTRQISPTIFIGVIILAMIGSFAWPSKPAMAQAIQSNIYYVSVTGLDSNPGTQSQPWKTIQKAADTMTAGDTVIVTAGNYPIQRVVITRAGSQDSPITYQAQGTVTQHGGFRIDGADYIVIKGFDITDTYNDRARDGAGIFVEGRYCDLENNYIHFALWSGIVLNATTTSPNLSTNCIVKNNRLYQNGQSGVEVHGLNHLIEGNEVWGTIQYHPGVSNPPSWVDADGFRFFGSGHIFRNNYIHDITYGPPGINPSIGDYNDDPHIDCFQTFNTDNQHEVASNILFEQNTCKNLDAYPTFDIGGKAFQVDGLTNNIVIRNNLIRAHGIGIFDDATNLTIVNNTFVGSNDFGGAVGIYLNRTSHTTIQNNIFAYQENGVGRIWPDSNSAQTLTVGYNCVYRKWGAPARPADSHDVWNKNPLFVDEANGNFQLKPNSPCIDAGKTIYSVIDDLVDDVRPQGRGYDMGAYETTAKRLFLPLIRN